MISVVIPSVRSSTIADAIAAVQRQTDREWELIISDQSGTDALLPLLEQFGDGRIRRLACPGRGASLARNFGVVAAKYELIAFTDDDCRPREDWIATIRRLFAEDPDLWMATGSLVAPPGGVVGKLQAGAGYVPELRRARPSAGQARIYSVTANAAYRRAVFEKAGPFDVCLSPGTEFFGGEEDDHGRRMELFDPVLLQTPLLEVEHTHGVRSGLKAVWDLSRKYAYSEGAVAGKQTLLSEDGDLLVREQISRAYRGSFGRSPVAALRSFIRAYFIRRGYARVLEHYRVDQELRLLVPLGTSLPQLYAAVPTLLDYCLPAR